MKKTWIATKNQAPVSGNAAFTPESIARAVGAEGTWSAEAAVANDGELNAGSKQELMRLAGLLAQAAGAGVAQAHVEEDTSADEAKQAIASAFSDKEGHQWQAVGEYLGDQVEQTLGRVGFTRRLLQFKQLAKGEVPRVRFRERDSDVYFLTDDPTVVASQPRQQFEFPPIFKLAFRANIDVQEIALDPGDILEDRYNDGLEQLMVGEDRAFKRLADTVAPIYNPYVFFPSLTPAVFMGMKNEVEKWGGLPVTNTLLSIDLWNDITTDQEFVSWWSEISKHEINLEGNLGRIGGVEIITDGWRNKRFQVLNQGEIYMLSHPKTLGMILQLDQLDVQSTNGFNLGQTWKGWLMTQMESIVLPNPYGIIRGQRT